MECVYVYVTSPFQPEMKLTPQKCCSASVSVTVSSTHEYTEMIIYVVLPQSNWTL